VEEQVRNALERNLEAELTAGDGEAAVLFKREEPGRLTFEVATKWQTSEQCKPLASKVARALKLPIVVNGVEQRHWVTATKQGDTPRSEVHTVVVQEPAPEMSEASKQALRNAFPGPGAYRP